MTEEELEKYYKENYEYFDVPGAGKIQISKEPNSITGGGVIDKKEAVRLVKHILRSVNLDELIP